MFTKLRNKLLRLIMIITSLMLVVAFILVFSGVQLSVMDTNAQRLSYVSTMPVYFSSYPDLVPLEDPVVSEESVSDIANGSSEITYSIEVADETAAVSIYEDSVMLTELQAMPSFSAFISIEGSNVNLNGVEAYSTSNFSNEFYSELAMRVIDENLTPSVEQNTVHLAGYILGGGVEWAYAVVSTSPLMTGDFVSIATDPDSLSNDEFEVVASFTEPTWVDGGVYQINFINTSEDTAQATTLIITLVVVGLLMLGIIFLISRYFANRAITPIEEMWEQQTRFVANASHELKTPLATMMASHDLVMMSPEATVKSQKEWLDNIRGGMDRMQRLLAGLLSLAQAEEGTLSSAEEVDVTKLVSEELDVLSGIAESRKLAVNRELEEVKICASEDMFREVVKILSENAFAYVDESGKVSVALETIGKQLSFRISNTGPGISAEDLEHVFERFYRADKARSSAETPDEASEHYGLGLSIAKSLVEQMGGQIIAESTPGETTTFTVVLDKQ